MEKYKFLGRYQIIAKVGQGAYGAVYKARDPSSYQMVALKVTKIERDDQGIPSTTLREISIIKSISHPNVVKLLGVNLQNDQKLNTIQLVFEYIDEDLGKFIKKNKKINQKQCKKIFHQIVEGVKHLHDRNIIHRDLKPQNILISKEGQAKIADFGLSRIIYDPSQTFSKQIQTLWYRSPQLLMGTKYYWRQIDVWSLGCILYELLVGSVLFKGDSEIGQIFKIFQRLGTPKIAQWPQSRDLPFFKPTYPKMNFRFENLDNVTKSGCDLMYRMLRLNPKHRISVRQILQHQFFNDIYND